MTLTATFSPPRMSVTINAPAVGVSTGNQITRDYVERDPYMGAYIVTPSAEEQTLQTNGLRMMDDITIAPIPQNYGLITWDGSTITVS